MKTGWSSTRWTSRKAEKVEASCGASRRTLQVSLCSHTRALTGDMAGTHVVHQLRAFALRIHQLFEQPYTKRPLLQPLQLYARLIQHTR